MASDFWIVLQWWGTLFLVGAVAYPLTKGIFGGIREIRGIGEIEKSKKDGFASRSLGEGWWDQGYLFSKAVGMAVVTWIVFVLGSMRVMPFSVASIGVALGVVFVLGIMLEYRVSRGKYLGYTSKIQNTKSQILWNKIKFMQIAMIVFEELFFLAALLTWSWVKGHEPSIRGLEKFMDYGFMQSILNATYFPPADMWYAPLPINYYYFGHMVTAVLTRLSGLDLGVTFNLMLATIFALTLTMSFSIGYQLMDNKQKAISSGILTAFLVTMAGNLQTIYAFTRGYTGDPSADGVKPFWELFWAFGPPSSRLAGLWGVKGFWGKLGEGMNTYWYPNATRFIPFTIHEFPSYSFVVSDVHGHVLSIPFVLLAIALLIRLFVQSFEARDALTKRIGRLNTIFLQESLAFVPYIFYGFLVGVLLMTNALDGPIYFALLGAVLGVKSLKSPPKADQPMAEKVKSWKIWGVSMVVVLFVALLTSLPFLIHFKSFVTGVAVNCPPSFLANMKFGPILFEGVEKCQRSPLWMWWLLWGFFVYSALPLIFRHFGSVYPEPSKGAGIHFEKDGSRVPSERLRVNKPGMTIEKILLVFFAFALVLVIVPEFIYFKDIYPAHFRSNTMFKLGYEAFVLFSIVSGYSIVQGLFHLYVHSDRNAKCQMPNAKWGTRIFLIFLLPQLFLVSVYPIFSVRSYFNSLRRYEGIDGLGWIRREYPTDYSAIEWLNSRSKQKVESSKGKIEEFITTNSLLPATGYFSTPILVEADGDSYTDYGRFSAFTGHPTIIGWAVHEWLWRGTYDVVAPRREEVRQIYESEDLGVTRGTLDKYNVRYVVVGKLEREKFKSLQEWKFGELGREAFRAGGTVIYEVGGNSLRKLKD